MNKNPVYKMAKKSSNNILIGLFVVGIIIVVIIAVVRNRAKKNQDTKGQISDGIVGPQRAATPPRTEVVKTQLRVDANKIPGTNRTHPTIRKAF